MSEFRRMRYCSVVGSFGADHVPADQQRAVEFAHISIGVLLGAQKPV